MKIPPLFALICLVLEGIDIGCIHHYFLIETIPASYHSV